MGNVNELNKEQALSYINKFESHTKDADNILKSFNSMVNESVNTNKGIWDGGSAAAFKVRWNKFADENFPEFMKTLSNQANNLRTAVDETVKADEED